MGDGGGRGWLGQVVLEVFFHPQRFNDSVGGDGGGREMFGPGALGDLLLTSMVQ